MTPFMPIGGSFSLAALIVAMAVFSPPTISTSGSR
jgi:hypothetical protein